MSRVEFEWELQPLSVLLLHNWSGRSTFGRWGLCGLGVGGWSQISWFAKQAGGRGARVEGQGGGFKGRGVIERHSGVFFVSSLFLSFGRGEKEYRGKKGTGMELED